MLKLIPMTKNFFKNFNKTVRDFDKRYLTRRTKKLLYAFMSLGAVLVVTGALQHRLQIATTGGLVEYVPHGPATIDPRMTKVLRSEDGGYITWYNLTDVQGRSDLTVQKISQDGIPQWGNGVTVDAGQDIDREVVTDGAGGAVIVWTLNSDPHIYTQHIDSTGTALFSAPVTVADSGVCFPIDNNPRWQPNLDRRAAAPDYAGGVIVDWGLASGALCAQRIDGTGNRLWGGGAGVVVDANVPQAFIVPDGAGGAFVAVGNNNAFIHHLNAADGSEAAGCPQQAAGGMFRSVLWDLAADGAGGVVIALENSNGYQGGGAGVARMGGDCAAPAGWPSAGVKVTDDFDSTPIFVRMVGADKVAFLGGHGNVASSQINLLNLSDGSSVWGGVKPLVNTSGHGYSWLEAFPSANGLMVAWVNSDDHADPSGGVMLSRLDNATGDPIAGSSGPVQVLADPDRSTIGFVSDGGDGFVNIYSVPGNGMVYSQHFNGLGQTVWAGLNPLVPPPPANAHGAASLNSAQAETFKSEDGNYITWYVLNDLGGHARIMVQKFDSDGHQLWGSGVAVNDDWEKGPASSATIATDGVGGVFVSWTDNTPFVYLQHVDTSGSVLFPSAVTTVDSGACVPAPGYPGGSYSTFASYRYPFTKTMVSDGAGGVVVLWAPTLDPTRHVCLQRLDANGDRLWSSAGVNAGDHYGSWFLTPDGANGAFVGVSENDAFVIHAAANGSLVGGCQIDEGEVMNNIVSDGATGFVILTTNAIANRYNADCGHNASWPVAGSTITSTNFDNRQIMAQVIGGQLMLSWQGPSPIGIYANLLNMADGRGIWGGVKPVPNASGHDYSWLDAVPSGGNVLVAWANSDDNLHPVGGNMFSKLSGVNGASVAAFAGPKAGLSAAELPSAAAISDGAGGMVNIYDVPGNGMVYSQRFDASGAPLWSDLNPLVASGGPAHGTANYSNRQARIFASEGGGYITWYDLNDQTNTSSQLMVQKFDGNGVPQWGNGVAVNSGGDASRDVVTDGAGGAIAVWTLSGDPHLYVQRVNSTGATVFPSPVSAVDSGSCLPVGSDPGWSSDLDHRGAIADGGNGVIVDWVVSAVGVCAQRLDGSGNRLWGSGQGVVADNYGPVAFLASDGGNGAFVGISNNNAWIHHLNGADGSEATGCPQVSGGGMYRSVLWDMIADGQGGVLIATENSNNFQGGGIQVGRMSGDCSVPAAWPAAGVKVAQTFDRNPMFLRLIGSDKVFFMGGDDTASASQASFLNLVDGTSVWGGEKLAATNYASGTDYSWSYAVPSGSDFIFAAVKSTDASSPSGGAVLAKLDGADGYPIVGFGGPLNVLDYPELPKTFVSDGADGLVAVYTRDMPNSLVYAQHFDFSAAAQWPDDNQIIPPVLVPGHTNAPPAALTPTQNTVGSKVAPTANSITYQFNNPGNADSFKLYAAPPGASMQLLATVKDPTATSITETGLTPNTSYANRVVVTVSAGVESAPSSPFPTVTTLQAQPTGISAAVINGQTNVGVFGDLRNLNAAQSGIEFTVKGGDHDGLTSGWLQTATWIAPDLLVGQTYSIEVVTRNQDGVSGAPEDFLTTVAASPAPDIHLKKAAAKISVETAVMPNVAAGSDAGSFIRYTITADNESFAPAYHVIISDPLPAGIAYKAGSAHFSVDGDQPGDAIEYNEGLNEVTANLPVIPPGGSAAFVFDVELAYGHGLKVLNKATATYSDIK